MPACPHRVPSVYRTAPSPAPAPHAVPSPSPRQLGLAPSPASSSAGHGLESLSSTASELPSQAKPPIKSPIPLCFFLEPKPEQFIEHLVCVLSPPLVSAEAGVADRGSHSSGHLYCCRRRWRELGASTSRWTPGNVIEHFGCRHSPQSTPTRASAHRRTSSHRPGA
uniref:Uncharacterized protein n=1 Tax=Oryza punctata TaxID=4537 RepID=A0A0E0KZI8_ORYPU